MLCNLSYRALELHGSVATWPFVFLPLEKVRDFNADLWGIWDGLRGFLSVLVSL